MDKMLKTTVRNKGGNKKITAAVMILSIILCVGFLTHSAILYSLNQIYPITSSGFAGAIEARMPLLRIAEKTIGVGSIIFFLGSIILINLFIKNKTAVAYRRMLIPFLLTVTAIFACILPFALLDRPSWANYLFPIWSTLMLLALLLAVTLAANFIMLHRNE